jgi:SAM-dependent methyltransferase
MTTDSAATVSSQTGTYESPLRDRIISLSLWLQRHQDSFMPLRLLDLRPSSEQQKQTLSTTLKDVTVVTLPIEFLKARSFELPARHIRISVLLQEKDMGQAEAVLLGVRPGVRNRPANPWKVTSVLLDSQEFWKEANEIGLVATSSQLTAWPRPRFWQPDPMVEKILLPLLIEAYSIKSQESSRGLQVLDLASGSGRDVAFLAEELIAAGVSNCRIIGIDHRYNEKERNIVEEFWERRGVGHETSSVRLDLSLLDQLQQSVHLSNVNAIICIRFWKPTLVKAIARSPLLHPGVLFGLSHFCKPFVGAPWDFDHPSEKTVIERHQLSDIFDAKWKILHDEISLDSDHGRTMVHFVAKKL